LGFALLLLELAAPRFHLGGVRFDLLKLLGQCALARRELIAALAQLFLQRLADAFRLAQGLGAFAQSLPFYVEALLRVVDLAEPAGEGRFLLGEPGGARVEFGLALLEGRWLAG